MDERASFTVVTLAAGVMLLSAVFGHVPLFAHGGGPAAPRPLAVVPAGVTQQTRLEHVAEPLDANADAELVPALHAWDPDVRFVFDQRLSKWM